MKGRRAKIRRALRRLLVVGSFAALIGGMVAAVDRGSEARNLSREIQRLERDASTAEARIGHEMRRLDSLTSRGRILREAAEMGLRPAEDDEITFLRDDARDNDESGNR